MTGAKLYRLKGPIKATTSSHHKLKRNADKTAEGLRFQGFRVVIQKLHDGYGVYAYDY